MKKIYLKILSITLGIVFLVILIANFGINFWLKYQLPDFIKNNTAYKISYQKLEVNLGTGAIFATGISVNNKNPQNHAIIGLQGTVDTLSVSRIGLYDVIVNKSFSANNLELNNPNLKIILPKPSDKNTGKKKNPFVLENINIRKGNIEIFRHDKQKFLSVKDLNLLLEKLKLSNDPKEGKLPIIFDQYDINAKNIFYRPDNVYAFTATNISTKTGQLSIKNFAMHPLLSYANFRRFYPKKRNLFDLKTSEMEFKGFILKDDKISLNKVRFVNPDLKMYTTDVKPADKEKSFTYDVNLEDVIMDDAKILILKPDGTPKFATEKLNMSINKLMMDDQTAKGNIPFEYNDFKINARQINYISASENVKVAAAEINSKSANLQNISVKPTVAISDKTLLDLSSQQVFLKVNEWKFIDNKLKLDVDNVLISNLNGNIKFPENPKNKKPTFDGIAFPLIVRNVQLKNSNLVLGKQNNPVQFNDLNATLKNLEMNETTVKGKIPFKVGYYGFSARNFNYKTQFYRFSASLLKLNRNAAQISNFEMIPTMSRAEFIRKIPTEKDLYNLKVNQITMNGNWDFASSNPYLNASQLTLNGMNAEIFRSKIPKDDLSEKPLYSKLLRSIKMPMFIEQLNVKNSFLQYEEDTKKSDGPGKLTFNHFNMNVKKLNSGKMKGKPTHVPIEIHCKFMNVSPMNVKWSFDTAKMDDAFAISGNISDLPAAEINPFIEPYLKIRATGDISDLIFDFKGNYKGLNGLLKMKHKNLRVSILKETGEKNKLLSAVANIFVRTDSGKYPESVPVDDVPRDKTKSFFNLFWKGIEEGLKKTLIGKNIEVTEKKVKNTVENTKTALEKNKKKLKETKQEVKEKVQNVKENINGKPLLKNVFRKKSEK